MAERSRRTKPRVVRLISQILARITHGTRTECFEKLLDLQDPEMSKDGIILLPMAVLAKPFTLNFRYQFMSDKPTSDLRHLGDYFIDWFLGEISKLQDYLRDYVTPVRDNPES
jgi:hypothetical protein